MAQFNKHISVECVLIKYFCSYFVAIVVVNYINDDAQCIISLQVVFLYFLNCFFNCLSGGRAWKSDEEGEGVLTEKILFSWPRPPSSSRFAILVRCRFTISLAFRKEKKREASCSLIQTYICNVIQSVGSWTFSLAL